jgi:hypothetical protein
MGMKTFDEVGNVGFAKSWQEENKDLILDFKAGDVREVRFLDAFLPMALHWVPFIKKGKNAVRFFPQMCLRWDLNASIMSEELECPACDRDVHVNENGIFWVLDVEALYLGDKGRVLKILEVGSRERKKIANLAKFNKVQGVPQHIGHSKYGRVVQVHYDPNNSDPALRWTFSKAERLPVKLMDHVVKVKIPEGADSDYAGKVFTFELQDLMDIVIPPGLSETKQKFARMKVDEAISRLEKEKKDKDGDDGDGDDDSGGRRRQRRGSSPRRRNRDEDDEPESRPSRRRQRPSRDDTDDPEDDFGDDGDDGEGADEPTPRRGKRPSRPAPKDDDDDDFGDDGDDEPAPRRGRKAPKEDEGDGDDDFGDDDGDDEPAPPPRRRGRNREAQGKSRERSPRRARRSKEDEGDGDDDEGDGKQRCNKKASRGAKCPQHKRCFGRIGDAGTEDCTVCPHRDECMDVTAEDDED